MSSRLETHTDVKQSNDQLKFYYKYAACSRGFTVAWVLMTICFLIINVIVFIEPEWIGDTPDSRSEVTPYVAGSPGVGYVGLYELCEFVSFGNRRICDGSFQDFSTILTDAFRASTFFIGVSCLVIFLCVLLFLLFLCVYEVYVYLICGSLQAVSAVFMFLGCVIFPRGWDHMYVRRICGDGVWRYNIGQCEMRWAYILAIIGIFDILMLAILAFVLAARHRRQWKNLEDAKQKPGKPGTEKRGFVVEVAPQGSVLGTSAPPSRFQASYAASMSEPVFLDYEDGRHRTASYVNQPRATSTMAGGDPRSPSGGPRSPSGAVQSRPFSVGTGHL